jgi:hypothetical protein
VLDNRAMRRRPGSKPLGLGLGLAVLVAALALAAGAVAQVLYVGDSLGVGTAPQLRDQLGDVAIEVDTETSRPSGAGLEVLRSAIAPGHEVVVFDLGTNDDPWAPEVFAADLVEAREIAGERCLVVATLNRPPLNGVPVDGLNRVVTRFALRTPGVELVDRRGAVAAQPGLLIDGVHATPEGYALRAQLFADAIGACLAFGGAGAATSPAPELEHEPSANSPNSPPKDRPSSPPPREPDPVHVLAVELAKAIAIGAEFG